MLVPLEPPPGLVSDDTTFASEGVWEDGSNVRFVRGKAQTIQGWKSTFAPTLTGVCRNTLAWTEQTAGLNMAFGTHSALQVYVAGALSTITPAGLAAGSIDSSGAAGGWGTGAWDTGTWSTPSSVYYPRTWSLATWADTLLASPRGGTIYQWSNNPAVVAAVVTNAPAEVSAMLVTPQRQVLAIGCTPSAGGALNPLCVRGSEVQLLTGWTPLSTNTSFEDKLEGGGRLITGRMVGDYVGLWSDNALYMGEYTGSTSQIYRWQLVDKNCGIVGPNAVHVYKGAAFWVSPDGQFRSWQPGSPPQVIQCPIRNDFANNVDVSQASKIVASGISRNDEIWWYYPDARDTASGSVGENGRYVAFSIVENNPVWFRGVMARTAAMDAGAQTYPVATTYGGMVYSHENGYDADGAALSWYIKSSDQYLNNAEQLLQLQGIWPDFEDLQGAVSLTVYVRAYPQATQVTKGPYALSSGSKKDFRATGRIASIKFSGNTGPTFARLGKPSFQAVVTGRR